MSKEKHRRTVHELHNLRIDRAAILAKIERQFEERNGGCEYKKPIKHITKIPHWFNCHNPLNADMDSPFPGKYSKPCKISNCPYLEGLGF